MQGMDAAFQSGFASALLDVLFNRMTDVFLIELKKFKNVDEAVEKLEITIVEAHSLLQKVDTSYYLGKLEHAIRKRADTLTTLCYDAEDVMDEIALMIAKHNSGSGKRIRLVRHAILRSLKTWTIPHGISKLQDKFDCILQQLKVLAEGTRNGYNEVISETSDWTASDNEVSLVGRDTDIKKIIQELISNDSNKGVSIIGLDGLGKTLLAQKIQYDKKIAQKFHVRLWVTVPNGCFKVKETRDRLELAMKASCNVGLKQPEKNVLIGFDNLLEVKYTDWDDFWCGMNCKDIGEIKLLITTLNPRISQLTGTCAYYLKYLSDECCKELIMKKACLHNSNLSGPWFSHVAGTLASKCAGLPLLAKVIGLVLAKCDEDNWSTLLIEDLWQWPVFREEILPALSSSYRDMQSHLKKCLAYFSLFPQNHCFNMEQLVQLWVGEGFIKRTNASSDLDQIGKAYIDDLVGRSILQKTDEANPVGRPRYELHRFTQKFARLVASKTCKQLENESMLSSIDANTRHLSLLCENVYPLFWKELRKLKWLRTILSLYVENTIGQIGKIPYNFFNSITWLRVLGLSRTNVVELPDSIYKLKHLRYLDVSNTPLQTLPNKLSKLVTLQFLKLNNTQISSLPYDFQNLTRLLYVDWDTNVLEKLRLPPDIGNIHGLQTLPLFNVGDKVGYSITQLRSMKCLRGSIHIKNLEYVKDARQAVGAKLDQKPLLNRIELQWNVSSNNVVAQEVLRNLRPPVQLQELKLTNYGGDTFPNWLVSPFPRLRKIHLHKCRSCTTLPALEKLPALETLVLQEMSSMKYINSTSAGSFPSLKSLEFNDMPELREWFGLKENDLPRLQTLKLISCPVMINIPSLENLSSLVDLQIVRCKEMNSLPSLPISLKKLIIRDSQLTVHCQNGGNEWQKIKCVPDVEIDDLQIQTTGVSSLPSTSSSSA